MTSLFLIVLVTFAAFAQDKQELAAEKTANAKLKGEHPLFNLMKTKNSSLKPEFRS